jgi:A/G-specific adenine glycosylase
MRFMNQSVSDPAHTAATPARAVEASPVSYHEPSFSEAVIAWQRSHGRHALPWQNTRDAYRIWLSEIMLQQTQVSAVIPYYQRFLERFPDVVTLAGAAQEEVMAHWSGLGYYSRARNLHRCAQCVVRDHGGVFPADPALLAELPGIGRSTAAAISAFAYGTRAAILDGNVKRVFCRVFGVDGFPGQRRIEDNLWQRAQALLPDPSPGAPSAAAGAATAPGTVFDERSIERRMQRYTQGLMDLGATVCTRSRPACPSCPLSDRCVAYATGRTAELPVRKPKKTVPEKHAGMLVVVDAGQVLLQQRPGSGIWGGLLSLPEFELAAPEDDDEENGVDDFPSDRDAGQSGDGMIDEFADGIARQLAPFGTVAQSSRLTPFSHGFTHFKLHVAPYRVSLHRRADIVGQLDHVWVDIDRLPAAPLPAPVKKLLVALLLEPDLFSGQQDR